MGAAIINDLKNNLLAADGANSLVPAVRTSSANGTGVDMVEADGPCFAILHVGTVSGTSPTLDVTIEESTASGGTYTAITGAAFTQITNSSHLLIINFKRSKRFVRAVATIAGTSPSFACAVIVLGMKKAN
jgi:hypothetical protein